MKRKVYIRKVRGRWVWLCYLCAPRAYGTRLSYASALASVARHCEHRQTHHRWVTTHRGPVIEAQSIDSHAERASRMDFFVDQPYLIDY